MRMFNSPELKGKLVLIDVFSYSCMNCLRSLEHIKRIGSSYRKFGLKTVILHPPEWDFEKDSRNIRDFLFKSKIKYPVVIDRNRELTKKLGINFWPAQILAKNGEILYRHIGEGSYKVLEDKIKKLLKINSRKIYLKEPEFSKFPTVYCGKKKNGIISRIIGQKLNFGIVYSDGNWSQEKEYVKSVGKSQLSILAVGDETNFVAQSLDKKPIRAVMIINNQFYKKITVGKPKLYNIFKSKNYPINKKRKNIKIGNKEKKLTIAAKQNLAIYSFSFK